MASLACAAEVLLPRLCIACLKVSDLNRPSPTGLGFCFRFLVVNESDDRSEIRIGNAERRHPLVCTPTSNNGTDLVTASIFGHKSGSREIGTGLASRCVSPMTETALRRKQWTAGLHLICRIDLRRESLRRRLRGRARPGTAPALSLQEST